MTVPNETERRQRIEELLDAWERAPQSGRETLPVPWQNERKLLPVIKLPLAFVVLNPLNQRPLWMSAAVTAAGFADTMVPDDVRTGLAGVIVDPGRREAFLLALGRKFDDTERRRTGEIAEENLVAACRAELVGAGRGDLAAKVQRVSLVSDQLGYDVTAPRLDGVPRRIESKGTRATGDIVSVDVTRNEAMAGLRDPSWSLVVSRVGPDDRAMIVGWLDGQTLRSHLPSDPEKGGRWQVACIYLDTTIDLQPGLPPY